MNEKPKPKVVCPECGITFHGIEGYLCPSCSRPVTPEEYRERQRQERGLGGPSPAHEQFIEATRRRFG